MISHPEAHLQLALDQPSLSAAETLVKQLAGRIDRLEVGTPLLLHAGMSAVEWARSQGPDLIVVADAKICDAGKRIAADAFGAGADVVTVVGAAIDEQTWEGVLAAARAAGGTDRVPRVLIDMIGWEQSDGPLGLAGFYEAAASADVPVEVCIHRPKIGALSFTELFEPLRAPHPPPSTGFLVAGKITVEAVASALDAGFETVIVGGTVADSDDPVATWQELLDEVANWMAAPKTRPS